VLDPCTLSGAVVVAVSFRDDFFYPALADELPESFAVIEATATV
jgi:hypothetical protein